MEEILKFYRGRLEPESSFLRYGILSCAMLYRYRKNAYNKTRFMEIMNYEYAGKCEKQKVQGR